MSLAVLYAFFAVVATAANLGAQALAIRIYGGLHAVEASVIVGTAVGLATKYLLDKRYIFNFTARDSVHDAKTFVLYSCMGVVTTLLFWGGELGFWAVFGTERMRYLGAVIGLGLGYWAKYHLDKRFVFRTVAA